MWYYELQEWPYGETEEYETFGPFDTFKEAEAHLSSNHANPGGWSTEALPGCKHDLLTEMSFGYRGYTHSCDRCGDHLKKEVAGK